MSPDDVAMDRAPPDAAGITDGAAPGACTTSRMCPGQVCDTARMLCVDCLVDMDCFNGRVCRANACVTPPQACRSSRECSGVGLVCETTRGECVECVADNDCMTGRYCAAGNVCSAQRCAPGVRSCVSETRVRVCDARGASFAEMDCPAGQACALGACGVLDAATDVLDASLVPDVVTRVDVVDVPAPVDGGRRVSIGVFRPRDLSWTLDLNGNGVLESCTVDRCHSFGGPGDLPVVGDWTGTGRSAIGVFRPSDRAWTLDLNGNGAFDGCGVDRCLPTFGMTGDTPVVGDWNGTGRSAIGVFRPSTRTWTLDNGNGSPDACGVDQCFTFGAADDLPVVGDWTGTGRTFVGTFRPSDRTWTLDLNGNGAFDGCGVDRCLPTFGTTGDTPVVGDWNGTGRSAIGVFRPSDRVWSLDSNNSGAFDDCTTDRCITGFGMTADRPIVGYW